MTSPPTGSAEIQAHEWRPPFSAASDLCGAMVERDGGGDECGLPLSHAVHRPESAAQLPNGETQ